MNVQAPHSPPARNPALHWQFIPKLLLFTTFGFGYTMLMAGPRPDDDIVVWTAYSEDMLQVMRASGIPVVVNVVADWDPSSQYHKKILFADSEIQQELQSFHFVVLEADYTSNDPEIKNLLRSHERGSPPVILIYPADPTKPAIVLSDLVQEHDLNEALHQAAILR